MTEILKFALENVPATVVAFGVIVLAITWIPFTFTKRGVTVSNPVKTTARVVLSVLGTGLLGVGIYLLITPREDIEITRPTITEYYGYTSLHGGPLECGIGQCEMRSLGSVVFRTPKGTEAKYVGRIKVGGAIKSFRTQPPHVVQNPNSFPGNPTLLDFAISPRAAGERVLHAQGELLAVNKLSAENGKVGHHLPYDTKLATVIVDFRTLGFKLAKQVSVTIETPNRDGQLLTGYLEPIRREFSDGQVILISAREVPANSSVIVSWGQ